MDDKSAIVALIGLRCSGKSSVGRELAKKLGRPFVDLDVEIARDFTSERGLAQPMAAGEILSAFGESVFRDVEQTSLERVLGRNEACVIATGGGVVGRAANRESLKRVATCVWLRVPIAELQRRMRSEGGTRPALLGNDPVTEIAEIEARRGPLYAEVANHTIECGTLGTAKIARRIVELLAERP
jgi:shikimate kinase